MRMPHFLQGDGLARPCYRLNGWQGRATLYAELVVTGFVLLIFIAHCAHFRWEPLSALVHWEQWNAPGVSITVTGLPAA